MRLRYRGEIEEIQPDSLHNLEDISSLKCPFLSCNRFGQPLIPLVPKEDDFLVVNYILLILQDKFVCIRHAFH